MPSNALCNLYDSRNATAYCAARCVPHTAFRRRNHRGAPLVTCIGLRACSPSFLRPAFVARPDEVPPAARIAQSRYGCASRPRAPSQSVAPGPSALAAGGRSARDGGGRTDRAGALCRMCLLGDTGIDRVDLTARPVEEIAMCVDMSITDSSLVLQRTNFLPHPC